MRWSLCSPTLHAVLVPICVTLGLATPQSFAEWARLHDGSVVKIESRQGAAISVVTADGKRQEIQRTEIDGLLQPIAAIRIVDDVMAKIGDPAHHDDVRRRLQQIGMAAVPQLLVHLRSREINDRRAAIAALQMVWSKEAEEPVAALLEDPDNYLRQMAMRLVTRRFSEADRLRVLGPLAASSDDPSLSGPALASALTAKPDEQKMLEALEKPGHWPALHHLLPRYHGKAFIPWSHRLLKEGTPTDQASAITALIYQMDDRSDTRQQLRDILSHANAPLRELAAEYFRWHGTSEDLAALEQVAQGEEDPYVTASIAATIEAILKRHTAFSAASSGRQEPPTWPNGELALYRFGLQLLERSPTPTMRAHLIEQCRIQSAFEPKFAYTEHFRLRPDPRHVSRLELIARLFAYPTTEERDQRQHLAFSGNQPPAVPTASALMPPIRDYFDEKRKSFGLFVEPGDSPFANSHHVGDDVAFGAQQRTIVSIGDGLVRLAHPGRPSWGGLVVIEHCLPDGSPFCALYGHLGPLIAVTPGDRVTKGQKLGTLGRDHVFATGGYRTHLHFGIHESSFKNEGRPWVGGYLSPDHYEDATKHRWVDPQAFLTEHGAG